MIRSPVWIVLGLSPSSSLSQSNVWIDAGRPTGVRQQTKHTKIPIYRVPTHILHSIVPVNLTSIPYNTIFLCQASCSRTKTNGSLFDNDPFCDIRILSFRGSGRIGSSIFFLKRGRSVPLVLTIQSSTLLSFSQSSRQINQKYHVQRRTLLSDRCQAGPW